MNRTLDTNEYFIKRRPQLEKKKIYLTEIENLYFTTTTGTLAKNK